LVIKVLEPYLDSPGFNSCIQTFFDHIRGLDSSSFVEEDELRLMPQLPTILDDYLNMLETMDENEMAQCTGIDKCIRRSPGALLEAKSGAVSVLSRISLSSHKIRRGRAAGKRTMTHASLQMIQHLYN
jgi:hypothetical protein